MTRAVEKFVKLMATDEGQDILKAFEHQANSVWDSGRRRYGTQTILAVLDDKIAYSLHQSYLWEDSSWRQARCAWTRRDESMVTGRGAMRR